MFGIRSLVCSLCVGRYPAVSFPATLPSFPPLHLLASVYLHVFVWSGLLVLDYTEWLDTKLYIGDRVWQLRIRVCASEHRCCKQSCKAEDACCRSFWGPKFLGAEVSRGRSPLKKPLKKPRGLGRPGHHPTALGLCSLFPPAHKIPYAHGSPAPWFLPISIRPHDRIRSPYL